MDRSKLRISKACQECRLRKIRCDGGEPCQRCQFRDIPCEYRKKARNRMKKSDLLSLSGGDPGSSAARSSQSLRGSDDGYNSHALVQGQGQSQSQSQSQSKTNSPRPPRGPGPYYNATAAVLNRQSQRISSADTATTSPGGRSNSLQYHSVAATHRASPSVFLQIYYGPSSNFSLMNNIYHRIEERRIAEAREAKRRRRAVAASNNASRANSNHGGDGGEGGANGDAKCDDDNDNDDNDNDHQDENGCDGGDGEDLDDDDATKEIDEFGPGLDLFGSRRLYFGELADGAETSMAFGSFNDAAAMFVDRVLAERLLERYLGTFWHMLPIWSRDTFRARLASFYEPPYLLASGDPDTIIVLLGLALGASMLEEELAAKYLYNMAKRWAAELDEMVNLQMVQISLMMSHYTSERARPNTSFLQAGTAVRKAFAAGLHKGVGGSSRGTAAQQSPDAARQMRITIWSLYFWETWLCFSVGRPSSFPESEMDVPFPTEEKLLFSVVTLARIMAKSATAIYRKHHDSLLPLWNAANDIRRELRAFAVQQREDFNFGVRDDPNAGELGVCQTMVSTLYHHTLILTFRPFLVLRETLRKEDSEGTGQSHPPPPPWLDTAAEYCIDAARHSIAFLIRAFEKNEMCRSIRYHGFFIEGASHVLAFELLNNVNVAGRETHLHWIQLAIRTLQLVTHNRNAKYGIPFPVDVAGNLERMIQSVYPDFRADQVNTSAMLPSIPSIQSGVIFNDTVAGQAQQQQQQQQKTLQKEQQKQQLPATAIASLDGDTGMMGPEDDMALARRGLYDPSASCGGGMGGGNATPSYTVAQQQTPQMQQLQQTQHQMMMAHLPPTIPAVPMPPPMSTIGNSSLNSELLQIGNQGTQLSLDDLSSLSNLSNALPPLLFPFTPFGGLDETSSTGTAPGTLPGGQSIHSPNMVSGAGTNTGVSDNGQTSSGDEPPADLTAADLGWDFDFGSMNMEAFLSIDPNMPYNF
ncbi:hypothetical protein SCUCBS95973_002190 [Sporothrix curviconia]|uniref:Zn(2)-C6 fungal-type domain-containing protein n=1 Tax=Sporothrix curviconia TaxID=1260050 RepID=A0ABP0B5N3_9PEZI